MHAGRVGLIGQDVGPKLAGGHDDWVAMLRIGCMSWVKTQVCMT